jgi:hypothetical protein
MTNKCKCFDETLVRVTNHVEKTLPEGSCDFDIEFEGRSFFMCGGDYSPVNPKIKYEYRAPKKGGGHKVNMTKRETIVMASFCCFCGRKLEGKSND